MVALKFMIKLTQLAFSSHIQPYTFQGDVVNNYSDRLCFLLSFAMSELSLYICLQHKAGHMNVYNESITHKRQASQHGVYFSIKENI